jgi:hypothetical protein
MAQTTFSGPVASTNGFQGSFTGNVVATTIVVAGDSDLLGTANVIIIPTVDPAVAGAIWNNGGTLAISAG